MPQASESRPFAQTIPFVYSSRGDREETVPSDRNDRTALALSVAFNKRRQLHTTCKAVIDWLNASRAKVVSKIR